MKKLENLYVNFSGKDILDSAQSLTTQSISGDSVPVKEFERGIAAKFGKKHAIAVSSGTISIFCALYGIGLKPGDEVLITPTSVIMSILPAIQLGATVKFIDTPVNNFGIDPDSLKAAITDKTKAVISVPMWGYPVPMDEITTICNQAGITLIEDISQSHATTWNGKYLGTFGEVGCLSTQERKLITTGEGGVIITDNNDIADRVTILKRYGLESNGSIGNQKGLNFKMNAFSAASGITQLNKLENKLSGRKAVADKIRVGIQNLEWFSELKFPNHSSQNHYSLVFTLLDPLTNNKSIGEYLAERSIISDPWRYNYKPLYSYPVCNSSLITNCPNAERLINSTFTLPCHEGMDESDIKRVIDAIQSFNF
jgi:perosamine synthetase